jgi:hypothetical protein
MLTAFVPGYQFAYLRTRSHRDCRDRGQVTAQSADSDPRSRRHALVLQERLVAGGTIAEPGLNARPKAATLVATHDASQRSIIGERHSV